ncbi:MAG: tRNA preQ1(34) S-adenosylmethionine ribosyltransferase-isomerase QueA [Planctomycetota bacterium]
MTDLELYDYELPRERIAQEPLATRSDARLMLVDLKSQTIDHYHVRDLPEILKSDDTLVLNNSRVVPARLVGYRTTTGGRWQGLFLRADESSGIWEVLTKTRGKLQPGESLTIKDRHGRDGMQLKVVSRTESGNLLVSPELPADFVPLEEDAGQPLESPIDWLQRFGRVPLPPYIRDGQMVDADTSNYQTVFAKEAGSVAAPTAGLHFTDKLLRQIRGTGVETCEITLHVGIGTFRPIQTDKLEDHVMHEEWIRLTQETADAVNAKRESGGRCVAVGTTSVRVLETAATSGRLAAFAGQTDLFIRPPHSFQAVDAMLTNFHLPKSSLLVMISAFASRELVMKAYHEAIEQEYRFFSYGDAMLIV